MVALLLVVLVARAVSLLDGEHALGLADNGDFIRVMGPAGLAHIERPGEVLDWAAVTRFFRRYYQYETPWPLSQALQLPSSLTARAVAALARHLPGGNARFDIGLYGLVHLLVAAALALSAMFRARPWRSLLALAMLWVLTDGEHLLVLNSFFAEPTAFVLLLVAVGLLLLHPESRLAFPAAAIALAGFSIARMLFVVTGLGFGLLVLARAPRSLKRAAPWLALGGLPLLFASHLASPVMARDYTYNAVFAGILADAPPAEQPRLLGRLGVSPELLAFAGHKRFEPAWRQRIDAIAPERWPTTSVARRAWVLATEPRLWSGALRRITAALGMITPNLGNYPEDHPSQPAPYQTYEEHSPRISPIRRALCALGWGACLPLLLLMSALALYRLRHPDPDEPYEGLVLALLLLFVLTQGPIAIVGDGYEAFARHLLAARFALDLALVIGLLVLMRRLRPIAHRWIASRRPEESPVD